ncbi:ribonucleoside-diphosphate reductase subunit alpha [Burkholderia sp. Ac-20365]|uniref:ribonucleoside-diphosphate reductase subunit alpha n=1 Tax=Burkholderia sp. Ac-20365 TaxID=2703897 RepID=UPI00197BC0DD|nr:ribonucleoside-diphosphate reductase subunit alpha [Burkholderia sp. Ac-20365]MBN3760961.1 ribonucleoside-diphosphate reductase subunit alpha [Burkholderia sp. Ac-20365]
MAPIPRRSYVNDDLINSKKVIKRTGEVVPFDTSRIRVALTKNALDARGLKAAGRTDLPQHDRALIDAVLDDVLRAVTRTDALGVDIETIQDTVELSLMRRGEHDLARSYVLYRAKRTEEREATVSPRADRAMRVVNAVGISTDLNTAALLEELAFRSAGLDVPAPQVILDGAMRQCFDGMPEEAVRTALLLSVREKMEMHPDATKLAAGIVIGTLLAEVTGEIVASQDVNAAYVDGFAPYIKRGIKAELLDEKLAGFDLVRLAKALRPERDARFNYLGIETIAERYLQHIESTRIELPQWLYMRVAMGLSLNEIDREARTIEFYELLSSNDFMSSTPTLFNSGTRRSQLSSCYLTTVADDLDGIYESLKDNALLSKFAGGLGNDWTRVRALGSHIKGTNGKSQGVVPFLKVVNDTAVAVNQGGKRKGAVCAYLETWHLDIEEFLELRKNTGDDRRRTHDMNTANWIPDLFMKRVMDEGHWTLFSPSDVPDLHEKFGKEFEAAYVQYEQKAARKEIRLSKTVEAGWLWRKMLGMLFETGHPWITFKDPCNVRSPQQHVGVVHSSNLCTEITLNTSEMEIAVCNLGSVNLVAHLKQGGDGSYAIDVEKLERTVSTAMRMLDNVIDINYYAVPKARNSNLKHRPVGLGIMGFHEALQVMGVAFASEAAIEFADESMEYLAYHAYRASNDLARERGRYSTFAGSLWDQGVLPHESVAMLEEQRGLKVGFEIRPRLGEKWARLKEDIRKYGMRNSNCLAIAPTATISNICGISASIDPVFQNIFVKSNLAGEFTQVSQRMVVDLKKEGLWDEMMVLDLKHFDGSLAKIERVPERLRQIYATAFEIDPTWLVECAARRQVWIDQAQSLNIYLAGASGKKLDEVYKLAWVRGLKTTYYLRTIAATHVEKSTVAPGRLNAVPSGGEDGARTKPTVEDSKRVVTSPAASATSEEPDALEGRVCMFRPGDPLAADCEACQ